MNRRQQGMAEARRAIIEAAGEQFAIRGYEGASFARVAEAMGRPKSAIGYHQFASKTALAVAVIESQQARWREIEGGLPQPHGLERLAALLLAASLDARSCPVAAGATRLLHELRKQGVEVPDGFDWYGIIAAELDAAARAHGVADIPSFAPELLLGATFGVYETGDIDDAALASRLTSLWVPLLRSFGFLDAEDEVQRAAAQEFVPLPH
ncbi:helix-turn-helix domain-containing protein [uncultured Microbacterium sp.]|uniref:helix-turn-helix domain-containing protein n=1 Tax=uncultured Microbacterium sp. TaxID=191216 RepID=UPI0025DADCE2|nr:helix-turn-helix domain-containing protein [uncultured Microbacterium sp.]